MKRRRRGARFSGMDTGIGVPEGEQVAVPGGEASLFQHRRSKPRDWGQQEPRVRPQVRENPLILIAENRLAAFAEAQKLHLELHRNFADLVQEQSAPLLNLGFP